ncbi:hypothetical protein TSUD_103270 [Trifolium subterraneum]|uniref:RRM domain-containing protein n=1 Tax=Trifolium subterraneum TaxID=3900 RepID=A0A2Z6MQX7_TRISU|nr:hypothetical protein TSUD_103270 [Trifolium subterraneum]
MNDNDTTASELWSIFNKYWRVGEVYIPDKRDRVGKRFGFARFEDVEDQQKLLQRIEETWIGTYKIRANLPNFLRGDAKKLNPNGGDRRRIEPVLNETEKTQNENSKVKSRGQTFKAVVQGGRQYIPKNKQSEWIAKANGKRKARLTDEEYRAGIMAIEAERAYEANKEWWERRFLSLTPWRPNIRPNRRRIWVRLFGVPLHIWSFEGFKKIIWRYGKLINLDRETLEQTRLDVARAQIEVSYWEMVDEVIEVKVEEEIFIIRMVEERFGCIDVGIQKDIGSNVGVGESEGDSNSRKGFGDGGVNDNEKWLEYASDETISVNGGDLVGEEVVCTAGNEGDTNSRIGIGEGCVLYENERCLDEPSDRIISDREGNKGVVEGVNAMGSDSEPNTKKVSGDDGAVANGGWLENGTDGIAREIDGDLVVEKGYSTEGIDQRVDTVVSTGQKEDRENQTQKDSVQVGVAGFVVVDSEGDGDVGGSRENRSGCGCERVIETQEPRVDAVQLGYQGLVTTQKVGDEVGNPVLEESGAVVDVDNGLQSSSGPSCHLGQRAGKQILVMDNNENNKLISISSTSIWADREVDCGPTNSNEISIEVDTLNKQLQTEQVQEKRKKLKDGGGVGNSQFLWDLTNGLFLLKPTNIMAGIKENKKRKIEQRKTVFLRRLPSLKVMI